MSIPNDSNISTDRAVIPVLSEAFQNKSEAKLPTAIVKIALTTLPPQIKTDEPLLAVDFSDREPFLEERYQIKASRTYRTLITQFSELSETIQKDERLMSVLVTIEKSGWHVPTEMLLDLKENTKSEWIARFENRRIKVIAIPSQQELSQKSRKLVLNKLFEEALASHLEDSKNAKYFV